MNTALSPASASTADTEAERLVVLSNLRVLDTPPERAFDTIVRSARSLLDCPIALISLVDDRRQWFKAKCGLSANETPRGQAFCAHAILGDDIFVIPDARADPRFQDNPLVIGGPLIRFYAGMPIYMTANGEAGQAHAMGTLCVIDQKPRTLNEGQCDILRDLAHLVETLFHARASAKLATDLAERQRDIVRALDRSHRQFGQAERIANIGSWRLTIADGAVEWSDQVFAIHDLPIGIYPSIEQALSYFPPRSHAELTAALARTIEHGNPFDVELDMITADDVERRVRSMGELETIDGVPSALIGVFQDVTTRHALEQALRLSANSDDLTGLANRARFNVFVSDEMSRARTQGHALVLMLLDLDNFKTVNDLCGHLAGDNLLRQVATQLRAPYLSDCWAARLGGDEFVLLVRIETDEELEALLSRLLADLRLPIAVGEKEVPVSATIGAAWLTDDVRDRSDFLHRADIALYEAKRARRGSAKVFGDTGLVWVEHSIERHARSASA